MAGLFVASLGTPSAAAAQVRYEGSVDAQLRRPAVGPLDSLLVRNPVVLPHLESAFGLDGELTIQPVDDVAGSTRPPIGERGVGTLLLGLGLFDLAQVSVAIPVLFQNGPGLPVDDPNVLDPLPVGAAGDLRLAVRGMWPDAVRLADAEARFGLGGFVALPTGDGPALSGDRSVTGGITANGALRWGLLRGDLEIGGRFRSVSTLGETEVASEFFLAWMAHRFASSMTPTRKSSHATCSASSASTRHLPSRKMHR